jgi:3-oxoacyl-[acyl-carrier-protein] synthase-1
MPDVYISADNIVSSLGFTTKENINNIKKNITGIKLINNSNFSLTPFYASLVDPERLYSDFKNIDNPEKFTRFEQMAVLSITDALRNTEVDIKNKKTLFIISTTKGNIDILKQSNKNRFDQKKIYLWNTAKLLQQYFENPNMPIVVSNACISGLLGIIIGSRLIQSSQFENVIITGGDILSEFVVSGFQSFLSLSTVPCRPFDVSRDGLSLGEGFGTIILTSNPEYVNEKIIVTGGSSSNDANHISGPSRTGKGLYIAIKNTLKEAGSKAINHIDYISAHGTGTVYNDEMESKAITSAGLENIPVNSFKGYWGHTLGAAGIIESIAAISSMKENTLYKTIGFSKSGVSKNINIIDKTEKVKINNCLKIASGFGGCNAGIIFSKLS